MLGGLSACARVTSLAAWIPIGVIVSFRAGRSGPGPGGAGAGAFRWRPALRTLLRLCAVHGLLGVVAGCGVDRWFYGFWAVPFLGNLHFNVLRGHGALYGTHPFGWYAYAGLPAICGVLLPFVLRECARVVGGAAWRGGRGTARERYHVGERWPRLPS